MSNGVWILTYKRTLDKNCNDNSVVEVLLPREWVRKFYNESIYI